MGTVQLPNPGKLCQVAAPQNAIFLDALKGKVPVTTILASLITLSLILTGSPQSTH